VIEEGAIRRWARWVKRTPKNRVCFMTCQGDPAEEILKIAGQYNVRKIVMGRGGDAHRTGRVTEAVGEGFPGLVEAVSVTRDDIFLHATVA
jgi:hypothetical protein